MTGPEAKGFNLKALAVPAYGPALFFSAAEGALLPVIPQLVKDGGQDIALAAFIAMLLGLGSWVFNVPAGIIVSRMGERFALIGAGIVGALGCLTALSGSIAALMVGMFVLGLASAVYLLARMKYLTEAVPLSHRARALSLLGGVSRIGVLIGPAVGAVVVGQWGPRAAFALAVAFLVAAIACSVDMPGVDSAAERAERSVPTRVIAKTYAPVYATVGVGVLLVQGVRAIRSAVIPLWCTHIGMDAQLTSVVYAASALIDMLVFYPAGKVMDLRGRAYVAVPAMTIMGISLLFMPLAHGFASVLIVSSALGFGNGIASGLVMTLGADFSPDLGRAKFLGLWRQLGDTGSTLGPLGLSAGTAAIGLAPTVLCSAAVGFMAAAMLAVWPARRIRQGWGNGGVPTKR